MLSPRSITGTATHPLGPWARSRPACHGLPLRTKGEHPSTVHLFEDHPGTFDYRRVYELAAEPDRPRPRCFGCPDHLLRPGYLVLRWKEAFVHRPNLPRVYADLASEAEAAGSLHVGGELLGLVERDG